ncbi:hypothetical protein SUGI_0714280 [Cryptomeria japonica]|nr:hypothetical protein SUGI_0714280 [Cryptomeria japonica]
MLFQLQNTITGCISHCGVLEFVAEEDLEVGFAPPLDYKEPERRPLNPANICTTATSARSTRETTTSTEHEEKSQCRFTAFPGVGRRLNGKPVSPKSPKVKSARSRSPSSLYLVTMPIKPMQLLWNLERSRHRKVKRKVKKLKSTNLLLAKCIL